MSGEHYYNQIEKVMFCGIAGLGAICGSPMKLNG
jgi:hypothetical protein